MIVRTIHNKDNPYFQLNRATVNDERLSYKAIGIHTYLMSKPDGWEANENDIAARHAEGRAAIRSGIQELIDLGYMVRVQLRKNKKVDAWRLDTYETPDLNPHYKQGQPAKVITIDLDPLCLECENLNVGASNNDHLESEKLQVENLQVENRTHSNYINTETNELKGVGVQPESTQSPHPSPLPLSAPSSANGIDALLDKARQNANGTYGRRREQVQIDDTKKKLDKFGINQAQFRAMVDSHLSAKGTKELADGDTEASDRELRKAQQFVVDLCGIGKRFWVPDGVKLVWDSWTKNDWRDDPSEQQLLEHANKMVNGKVGKGNKNGATSNGTAKPVGTVLSTAENLK